MTRVKLIMTLMQHYKTNTNNTNTNLYIYIYIYTTYQQGICMTSVFLFYESSVDQTLLVSVLISATTNKT